MLKDSKILLILLVSVALFGTWIYHFYDKTHYHQHNVAILIKDSLATQEAIRDSLQKLFNEKSYEADTIRISADSLRGRLDSTRSKIYTLRNQIAGILKNRSATREDLKKANGLIQQYKQNIENLKSVNNDLESERLRLSGVLTNLNTEMDGLQKNIQRLTDENKQLTEQISNASIFFVSDLNLSAVATRSGNREVEASAARKANKFVFSFTLQNNVLNSSYYDVYVVIVQPGNKILQNDVWGADYFTLKSGTARPYTTKVHFEYNRGEKKKILYTLQPEEFLPGTYTMQVYQNGVAIGETSKALN
jgi:hypothetical protein